jgi:anti-sigma factor RsiW
MEKRLMTCEEFQLAALDLEATGQEGRLQMEAREHLRECAHCAAFQQSWLELRADLRGLGAENQNEQTPSRVEMRLRQEFRTIHKTLKGRRNAVIATWALAAAAVLVATIGWINWQQQKSASVATIKQPAQTINTQTAGNAQKIAPGGPELGEVLVASNDASDFTLLPESMPGFLGDATVVHVQMQRGALGALGLTVNEEHAGDWIQVDLLLGDDGQPQAVRLPQSTN